MADDKDIGGYLRGMDPQAWGKVVENYFLDAENHELAQDNQQLKRARCIPLPWSSRKAIVQRRLGLMLFAKFSRSFWMLRKLKDCERVSTL